MRFQKILLATAFLAVPVLLTGCATSFSPQLTGGAVPALVQGQPFKGSAMGGQQPITSARIYLYAADNTAYGHASDSLIKSDPTAQYPSQLDSNGRYYVTSDPQSGIFYLEAGQYQCAQGQTVYLYLLGGSTTPTGTQNPSISEMASLGVCNAVGSASPFSQLTGNFVYMNEVSTVAAAYALAGFATDSTHVASAPSALSQVASIRAFQNTANLYNINAGANQGSLTTTPSGNGMVPAAEINTIADILASCINAQDSSYMNCSTLFTNAQNSAGVSPTETSTAAINIAHNPSKNVSALLALASNSSPFMPVLVTTPNDLSVVLTFQNPSGSQPSSLAVDANQDVWFTNSGTGSVTELSSTGEVLSGTGYRNGNMVSPEAVALDTNGNAYIVDAVASYLFRVPNGGGAVTSYAAPDLTSASSVAIDVNGYIWAAQASQNAVQFKPTGIENFVATGGGLVGATLPGTIAIDPANDAYILNYGSGTVAEFNSAGTPLSPAGGYNASLGQAKGSGIAIDATNRFWSTNTQGSTVTIGTTSSSALAAGSAAAGVDTPSGISFDGAGNAWIADANGAVSVLSKTGAAVSGSNGYSGSTSTATITSLTGITAVAVDSMGDVWVADPSNGNVSEFLGAATPVVTPLVAALSAPYTPASMP
jgi:streptogramin lyase